MFKSAKIAAAVSAALLMGAGVAQAQNPLAPTGAVAENYLEVSSFQFLDTSGGALQILGINAGPATATVALTDVDVTGEAATALNGVNHSVTQTIDPFNNPGDFFDLNSQIGAGTFTPGTVIPVGQYDASATYAAANSAHSGSSIAGGTLATTHSRVNLSSDFNEGSATSEQSLFVTFGIIVGSGGQDISVSFDAEMFLRAAMAQDEDFAEASVVWNMSVVSALGELNWSPNGNATDPSDICAGVITCNEIADSFSLNRNANRQNTGEAFGNRNFRNGNGGATPEFELHVFLPEGEYEVSIQHSSLADARVVPEPSALALVGLGMLGVAFGARARRS